MMAPRDILMVSKRGYYENGVFDVCTSIDSPAFPETSGVVRAKVMLGGYLVEPIIMDEEGNIAKVTSISESNFGGSIPVSMLKSLAVKHVP